MKRPVVLLACLFLGLACRAQTGPVLPGQRPDGSILLHSQWPIAPVGRSVPLGDFPINMAVHPSGRWVAVLQAGYGGHEVRVVELATGRTTDRTAIKETFCGIAFSRDGSRLVCSGGGEGVLHLFGFSRGRLYRDGTSRVLPANSQGVVAGVALSGDARSAVAAVCFESHVVRVDLDKDRVVWSTPVGPASASEQGGVDPFAPNSQALSERLLRDADPLNVVWDQARGRVYATLWGESSVAVLDAADGRILARWPTGLHPNEMVLGADGRLFVSDGGMDTVTVFDVATGSRTEVLRTTLMVGDPPGETPDSLALSSDGKTLFVANASTNTVAVFDVSRKAAGAPLGFIPTGWFASCVRVSPDGDRLMVLDARGLWPHANAPKKPGGPYTGIAELYDGNLSIIDLPGGDDRAQSLARWTSVAQRLRPRPAPPAAGPATVIRSDGPVRHVVYIIRENRTYDQVLGDLARGNGDPGLCLFPEKVTPNAHAISRQFVTLDNFYAQAEVSASGHEWSTAAYCSEFVEKTWPINYGHGSHASHVGYPAEGSHEAAFPAAGYLWDSAARSAVTYRSYGEFAENPSKKGDPVWTNMAALAGHIDPGYPAWSLDVKDCERAARFVDEMHRYEREGDMPRLQVLRLPNDHTAGGRLGALTPTAMVAENDLALGRIVEALSHSRFWASTVVFVVEDDAQNGPDHVDAHRTVALVASPWSRTGRVDSTPYTTCSMLRTLELILGLKPLSVFDATATPMSGCFQDTPSGEPYTCLSPRVDLGERNTKEGEVARISEHFDFSREDLADEDLFNRVIWQCVRGERSTVPAPVHAAFVRRLPLGGGDDDDD